MNAMVIRHKESIRLAVAVFWRVCLGNIKVRFKPKPNWSNLNSLDFQLLGYSEVRAQPERRLIKREYSFGEYWQKQRLVQFQYGNTVVMEVLLIGTETVPGEGRNYSDYYWAPGAARYRPVVTSILGSRKLADSFGESLTAHGLWLGTNYENERRVQVKHLGEWVNIPEKKLKALWPSFKPWWGIELPAPVWPS